MTSIPDSFTSLSSPGIANNLSGKTWFCPIIVCPSFIVYSSAPKFKSSVILAEGITKPKSFDTCLLTPVTRETKGPVLSLSTSLIRP